MGDNPLVTVMEGPQFSTNDPSCSDIPKFRLLPALTMRHAWDTKYVMIGVSDWSELNSFTDKMRPHLIILACGSRGSRVSARAGWQPLVLLAGAYLAWRAALQ